jgi:hypothetical protein
MDSTSQLSTCAQLIPDEMKKRVLLKCAGIDYVSPITATAFLASTQVEDVKLAPEEEADQLAALQHESVEGLTGSELAAAEAREKDIQLVLSRTFKRKLPASCNAEKDVVKDLQRGKTSMWDMTKMGENHSF